MSVADIRLEFIAKTKTVLGNLYKEHSSERARVAQLSILTEGITKVDGSLDKSSSKPLNPKTITELSKEIGEIRTDLEKKIKDKVQCKECQTRLENLFNSVFGSVVVLERKAGLFNKAANDESDDSDAETVDGALSPLLAEIHANRLQWMAEVQGATDS
jgi:hypothetical protein